MAISSDTLIDRLRLKRQLALWRLLAIGAVALFLVLTIEGRENVSPVGGNFIARMEVYDIIFDDPDRDALLEEIGKNKNAKALIVVLDTPGGTAVGGEALYRRLREVAKKKPVVAIMRTLCTSAGYMAAMGAERVFAMDSTLTGSIGVLVQSAELTGLADKLGVTPITVKSGENKAAPSVAEKFTPEQRAVIQEVIDDFYGVFVDIVADSRNMERSEVLRLSGGGRIYSGRQAVKNGLVDEIGGIDAAVAWLKREKNIDGSLDIRDMEVKREHDSILDRFADYSGMSFLSSRRLGLDGMLSIWHSRPL